jgi:hypothetical protein
MAILTTKKPKPLTVKQQAINQVQAVNKAGTAAANAAAAKAQQAAKNQAAQAIGFQHALADITQGDAGRIYDAYGNAADKVSAYGNLATASAGDSSRSAAQQAQNYLGTVGPDVGAETRPDISGALRALGAIGVGDVAGALKSQGAYAQERQQSTRDAQLMRLADIAANAGYQGTQTANQLREDEVTRQAGSRSADVQAAVSALKEEARATDDQRMKDQAFKIELAQKRVDLAASRLANATGEIERKAAQKELDNYQVKLNAELASTRANTKATLAGTKIKQNAKGLTPYQQTQAIKNAHDAAQVMAAPVPVKGAYGVTTTPEPLGYQQAVKQLSGKYGLTKAQAVDVLNNYYEVTRTDASGKTVLTGRPPLDFQERAQLKKLGYTAAQITKAMNGHLNAKLNPDRANNPGEKLYAQMVDRLGS